MAKETNKWKKALQNDNLFDDEYSPTAPENCIRTQSPSVNWLFGHSGFGLPKISTLLLYAPPKAGKSLISKSFVKQIQMDDPEAITIEYNTEFRGSQNLGNIFDIDLSRHIVYETNKASDIFDHLSKDVAELVENGMPLRLVIIDSITYVMGVKTANADSVENHTMGDDAMTQGKGLKQIMPFLRKNKIPLILTAHMRANIDMSNPKAPPTKEAVSWMVKHSCDYFMSFRKATAADDKIDIEGNEYMEAELKDIRGNKLNTGHKIVAKMDESSHGASGRQATFTLDYQHGIVNQHEEIFLLGKNLGIITTTNNRTYEFGGKKFNGKKECALAIKDDPALAEAIVSAVKLLDKDLNN